MSRRMNQAVARTWHRGYWPETNVERAQPARAALVLTGTEDVAATLANDRAIGNTPSLSLLLRYLQLLDPLVNQLTLVGQILARRPQVHPLQLFIDFLRLLRVLLGHLGDQPGQLFTFLRRFFRCAGRRAGAQQSVAQPIMDSSCFILPPSSNGYARWKLVGLGSSVLTISGSFMMEAFCF